MATVFKKNTPQGFRNPTQLPDSDELARMWQKENRQWWEENPMRYDWADLIKAGEFTREFYSEIDKRFFRNAQEYLKNKGSIPFEEFIDFKDLQDKDVLEIGVGLGSHAQLLVKHSKSFSGIDITEYSVKGTKRRMNIFKLAADIRKMDAEHLAFADNSFDFVWSWGVVHHSANTRKILEEIRRVLRPGGKSVIMVYHRGWWNYYVVGVLRWIVGGNIFKGISLMQSIQSYIDGVIARYYSKSDWRKLVGSLFNITDIKIRGPKTDVLPLPRGKLKKAFLSLIPNRLNRFLTEKLYMGFFLISTLEKPSGNYCQRSKRISPVFGQQ